MYDCSTDSYEENVRKVKEMAEITHSYGATIEGELGHVGDNEDMTDDGTSSKDPSMYYTDPKMALDFVQKTGVDALAVAVGNAHGAYKFPPKLDFARIREIAATVDVPLVLHGGSGLTDLDFKTAIREGISKVNIFTDINVAAAKAVSERYTDAGKGLTDLIPSAVEAVRRESEKTLDRVLIGVDDPDGAALQVSNMVRDAIKPDLTMFLHYQTLNEDGKQIIAIDVSREPSAPIISPKKG